MSFFRNIAMIMAPAVAFLALAGCATPFRADVARFQQMPVPQGQSFAVVADDPQLSGGLEFAQYADLVAAQLIQDGYVRSADPAAADLIVRLDYSVDDGREKVRSTGFGYDPYWGPGRPWYGGYWRRPYIHGFYDPFLFGPGYNDIESYTIYTSSLTMKIDRTGDNRRLFEGTAKAQSLSNKLTYLVPNLVEAMFTNFPGQSGETVRISVAPEKR
ncbi:DUF4136 domain-containing protein [Rhizorhapis sp. SPR117]|uniref:DUF4136 domain-containing protein n=1 Tax=Rhizorhapis sp. SPR117 TaxID=2912611 RepID=UPI001F448C06|nr:DUF4136 domain-containing protein [Rhizorhapis sp. SPR117]